MGTGPDLSFLFGLTFDQNRGSLYVLNPGSVLRIDPATGNREAISTWYPSADVKGTGPALFGAGVLGIEPDGSLITFSDKFYRINPTTGDRSLIADDDGYLIEGPFGIVPHLVPEPSAAALAGIGTFALLAYAKRRRSI